MHSTSQAHSLGNGQKADFVQWLSSHQERKQTNVATGRKFTEDATQRAGLREWSGIAQGKSDLAGESDLTVCKPKSVTGNQQSSDPFVATISGVLRTTNPPQIP